MGIEHHLPLHITWDGTTWRVTFSDATNLPCASAQDDLQLDTSFELFGEENSHSVTYSFTAMSNHAAGCLVVVAFQALSSADAPAKGQTFSLTFSSQEAPVPPLAPAYLLHRFGLFLAANAAAHRYWPNLPVADAYEQQLAQLQAKSLPPV